MSDRIFWIIAVCVSVLVSLVCFGLTELYIVLLWRGAENYTWGTAIIGVVACFACWWSLWFAVDNLSKTSKSR